MEDLFEILFSLLWWIIIGSFFVGGFKKAGNKIEQQITEQTGGAMQWDWRYLFNKNKLQVFMEKFLNQYGGKFSPEIKKLLQANGIKIDKKADKDAANTVQTQSWSQQESVKYTAQTRQPYGDKGVYKGGPLPNNGMDWSDLWRGLLLLGLILGALAWWYGR